MFGAQIIRHYSKDATTGMFLWNEKAIGVTLELPWRDNLKNGSCIPEGTYRCERTRNRTTSGGLKIDDTYEVLDVKDRAGILFHVGNAIKDTHGCILIGSSFATIDGRQMITNSRLGFGYWLKCIGYIEGFNLKIVGAP